MNTPLTEGTILGSQLWDSRLVVCSNQDVHGRARIALAIVRHLAGNGQSNVYALDELHSGAVEVDVQDDLDAKGWQVYGTAVPSHTLDVACGRGGGKVLDNAGRAVYGGTQSEESA